jgi:hypothetical protein
MKHADQWRISLKSLCAPIRDLPVDHMNLEAILKVLTLVSSRAPVTALRLRGRIETVLDAARVRGHIAADRANPRVAGPPRSPIAGAQETRTPRRDASGRTFPASWPSSRRPKAPRPGLLPSSASRQRGRGRGPGDDMGRGRSRRRDVDDPCPTHEGAAGASRPVERLGGRNPSPTNWSRAAASHHSYSPAVARPNPCRSVRCR